MDMLYLLVPMSLVLVALIAAALWWALHAGQYDDLDRPAEAILLDDDRIVATRHDSVTLRNAPQKSSSQFPQS
ncbi:cbb3-type cytochrome oxidase assembly protein CcoS [Cupriavidus plantarum]|uniref:cbb3-type cytochrome oxidase assembly protein CcoS n=1 Tax=Cupriavidus plantarum TaxID=942865 RepID=UPI0017DFF554|nr:cbb3-type cytochrome oxidase assembly protein CcoS [Cupriavidus plantarum]NYH99792.1 cbb3-type cytochrome oxidase maturation protein [Cupriavidus plantarum]